MNSELANLKAESRDFIDYSLLTLSGSGDGLSGIIHFSISAIVSLLFLLAIFQISKGSAQNTLRTSCRHFSYSIFAIILIAALERPFLFMVAVANSCPVIGSYNKIVILAVGSSAFLSVAIPTFLLLLGILRKFIARRKRLRLIA